MDRRLAGGIVVLVVLMAAIVAPNWSQRRTAGQPVALTIPGPPAVGDCVTSVPDIRRLLGWDRAAGSNFVGDAGGDFGWDRVIDYPTADFAPCDGPILGEVSSLHLSADTPDRIAAGDYQTGESQCALESIPYTGSIPPIVNGSADRPSIVWAPAINFQNSAIGPTAAQRAVGQQWSACIVGSGTGLPYVGTLDDVLVTGELPSDFGNCWVSDKLQDSEQIACDQPHRVELLGTTGLGSASYTAAEVHRACATYAGRVLRSDDPTRGGAIRFEILDFQEATSVVAPSDRVLRDTYITCVATVRVGLRLTGTLVGLQDRPLPAG